MTDSSTNPTSLAFGEELRESITAFLLGFAVKPDGQLTFSPFEGHEEIKELTEFYLNATVKR